MNAKQRRKQKRSALRVANKFIEIFDVALDELESGKYTIKQMREQTADMKKGLAECV